MPVQTSFPDQPNHPISPSTPIDSHFHRKVRLTGYRIANIAIGLAFAVGKFVMTLRNLSSLSNATDLVVAVVCGAM